MTENENTQNQHFLVRDKREKNFKDDGILFLGYWFGKFFSGRKEHDYDKDLRVTEFAKNHSDSQEKEKQKRLIKASDKLLSKAWSVEIIAATIGVIVAVATGYSIWFDAATITTDDGQFGLGTSTWINIFLGSLPFIMVAIVELAKIPLARVVYNATGLLLKTVFSVVLIGAIIITFETLATGFERSIAGQLAQISTDYAKLADKEQLISVKTAALEANESNKKEDAGDTAIQNTNIGALTGQLDEILKRINGSEMIAIKGLEENVKSFEKQREAELASLYRSTESKNKDVKTRKEDALSGVTDQIIEAKQDKKDAKDEIRRITTKCDETPSFLCGSVDIPEQEKKIAAIEVKLAQYKQEKRNISAQFTSVVATNKEDKIREKYRKKIDTANNTITAKRKDVERASKGDPAVVDKRAEITDAQEELRAINTANRASAKDIRKDKRELRAQITKLESELPALQNKINKKAANINIYRLAYMTSPDPEIAASELIEYHKVKPKWVMTVAEVWFGTLAFVVSIVGTLMAFGSFVLRDWHLQKTTSPGEQISRTFNWFMHYPKLTLDALVWLVKLIGRLFIELGAWFVAMKDWILRDEKIKEVEVEKIKYKNRSVFFPFLTDEVMDVEMKSKDDKPDESEDDVSADKTEEDTAQDDVATDDKDK